MITPYYSRPTQQGLFEWYSTVAREFPDLPMVVYNVPVRTAVDIAPETVGRLRRAHDNIVGIKETTSDFEHASYVLAECGRDFLVYCGIELLCYPMLAIGGVGHLSCVANVAPEAVRRALRRLRAGDHEEAVRLHYELHPLVDMAFLETNPGPVKWAMEQIGVLGCGAVRPPLARLRHQSTRANHELLVETGCSQQRGRRAREPDRRAHCVAPDAVGRRRRSCTTSTASSGRVGRATFETLNPATNLPIADVAEGAAADVDAAVRAARARVRRGAVAAPERDGARGDAAPDRRRRSATTPTEFIGLECLDIGMPIAQMRGLAARAARELRLLRRRRSSELHGRARSRSATSSSTTRCTSRSAWPG